MNAKSKPDTLSWKPKLLDSVRFMLRTKHYARSTEKNYMQWIYLFIVYHKKRHSANANGIWSNRTGKLRKCQEILGYSPEMDLDEVVQTAFVENKMTIAPADSCERTF